MFNVRMLKKEIYIIKNIKTITYRSRRPEAFCKKGILENLTKFTGKHLCQSLFFNKVAGLRICEIFKNAFFYRTPLVAATVLFIYFCDYDVGIDHDYDVGIDHDS